MGFTRRGVLVGGLVAGGLGVGAAGFGLSLGAPAPGAAVLTRQELDVVAAVAEVLFPGDPFPVDGLEAGVPTEVDRIVGDLLEEPAAAAFRYVLRTLEWGTLASRGHRFTALPVTERAAVLEAWSDPSVVPRRIALESLKAVLGMAYFAHPDVVATIGWRTGCGGTTT